MSSTQSADVRPPVADLDPALAALRESRPAADRASGGSGRWRSFGDDDPHVAGELVRERIGVRRLGDRLAGVSVQGGLGVEALEVAGAADHEQPDHVLGLGAGSAAARRRAPAGGMVSIGPRDPVAMEHRAQGQAGEAHPHVRQEPSSVARCSQWLPNWLESNRHEVVMVEQHVDQVLARSLRWGGPGNARGGAARERRQPGPGRRAASACVPGNLSQVVRSSRRRRSAEDALERSGHEGGRRSRRMARAGSCCRELARQESRLLEAERAVGQGQRLLGHDALGAAGSRTARWASRTAGGTPRASPWHGGSTGCGAGISDPSSGSRSGPPRVRSRLPATCRARCRAPPRPPCAWGSSSSSRCWPGHGRGWGRPGRRGGLHPVGGTGDDQAVDRLHAPALGPEAARPASRARRGASGGVPLRPKSNTDGTSGVPKCRIQIWLTATRAVSGLSGSVIQRARASRRPVLVAG